MGPDLILFRGKYVFLDMSSNPGISLTSYGTLHFLICYIGIIINTKHSLKLDIIITLLG